jgi:AraC family transcriptional regulator
MHDPTPAVQFHHFGVRLDRSPVKMGWTLDGRSRETDLPSDHVSVIPAGVSLSGWWNRPVDFACLYFTPASLMAAAGEEAMFASKCDIRPALSVFSPTICELVRALCSDAGHGHPYGKMFGESLFVSLAAVLVHDGRILQRRRSQDGLGDRRIRRALDFIHEHLFEEMDVGSIAEAAETSPYHLSRVFRSALGCSIWQYVSRNRVQLAIGLMKDPKLTLAQVAKLSGFESYSTFAATFKSVRSLSPAHFRTRL